MSSARSEEERLLPTWLVFLENIVTAPSSLEFTPLPPQGMQISITNMQLICDVSTSATSASLREANSLSANLADAVQGEANFEYTVHMQVTRSLSGL